MRVPPPHHPTNVQANLVRILATTAMQWGLSRRWIDETAAVTPAHCSAHRPRDRNRGRVPPVYLRASAQTTLGLAWGWCY